MVLLLARDALNCETPESWIQVFFCVDIEQIGGTGLDWLQALRLRVDRRGRSPQKEGSPTENIRTKDVA